MQCVLDVLRLCQRRLGTAFALASRNVIIQAIEVGNTERSVDYICRSQLIDFMKFIRRVYKVSEKSNRLE